VLRDNYAKQAAEKGEYMMKQLKKLVKKYPQVYKSVTGK
jgi:acetylornithine/succinyldiaminopimelate/putrescine aminotransferase